VCFSQYLVHLKNKMSRFYGSLCSYTVNHKKRDILFLRCTHKGDVVNFTTVACRIFSWLKWYKNYKNRLRLTKVIVKNKMSRFYGSLCNSLKCSDMFELFQITWQHLWHTKVSFWNVHDSPTNDGHKRFFCQIELDRFVWFRLFAQAIRVHFSTKTSYKL